MANCLPFDSIEHDRAVKSEDWAWYFATFLANGVFPKPSDGLQVIALEGMDIRVNAGYAFINGYGFRRPKGETLTISIADGIMNRIDRIVIRWDLQKRDIYIDVLKGTPSARPVAASLTRNAEIWELAIADIYVGKGVLKIQAKDIKDQRFNNAVCGIVKGTIEEIDASVLTKQFDDFFSTYSREVLENFNRYKKDIENYLNELTGIYNRYVEEFEQMYSEYERNAAGKYQEFENLLERRKSDTERMYSEYEASAAGRYGAFEDSVEKLDTELLAAYREFEQRITTFQSAAESNFENWFESIKGKLNGDIAGSLQLQLERLQGTVDSLYSPAVDSDIDRIIEETYTDTEENGSFDSAAAEDIDAIIGDSYEATEDIPTEGFAGVDEIVEKMFEC